MTTHKVRLFKTVYLDTEYYSELIKDVTEWYEVTTEELKYLKKNLQGYQVLELVDFQAGKVEIDKIIKEAKRFEEEQKARAQKYQKEEAVRQAKALERKLAKAKKLLEQHSQ